jgi:uncharacterized protein YhfF
VLRGEKTATSSLLAEWDADNASLPEVGDRLTVIDSDDRPVSEIEIIAVDVMRLGDVDLELARAEGEGFASVDEWRDAHERFWRERVLPRLPAPLARSLDDDAEIVVERFRLVSSD